MAGEVRQRFLSAIAVLYDPGASGTDRAAADRWLAEWQMDDVAWSLADELLHDASMPQQVHFLCSQTLRTKVERDFDDLPENAFEPLRDSLMSLLFKFGEGVPSVRTQLCLALAAMTAHVPRAKWGANGPVAWFAEKLGSASESVALPCMLELLTVLPQEAHNTKAAVHPDRRAAFRHEMRQAVGDALQVLSACLNLSADRLREHLLQAFGSWIRLSGGLGFDGATLQAHPLTRAALDGLNRLETFDAAVNAVSDLVWCTAEEGMPEPRMMPLVNDLVPAIMALRPRFAVCARRAAGEKASPRALHGYDDDEETARGMARLFAEVGEAYVGLIATGEDSVLEPVQALLEVAAHADDDVCSTSFLFWHSLSEKLCEQRRAPGPNFNTVLSKFTPCFERLMQLVHHRVKYPLDYDTMTEKEKRELKDGRYKVADTLEDCANVLLGERSISILVQPLRDLSAAVAQGQQFDWRTAEAALYCVRSIHIQGQRAPVEQLVELFSVLPQMPKVPKLQYTVALTCQAYADWVASPQASSACPGLPEAVFQLVSDGLTSPEASFAAAPAMFHICDALTKANSPALPAVAPRVLAAVQAVQPAGELSRSGGAAAVLPVAEVDVLHVLKAAAVLARTLAEGQASELARVLLEDPVRAFTAASEQPSISQGTREYHVVRAMADRVSTVARFAPTSLADLVVQVLVSMWPAVTRVLERCGGDMDVVEGVCRMVRYVIKQAGVRVQPLLGPLCALLPEMFASQRQSCYLYVTSEIIKVYGPTPGSVEFLRPLFMAVLEKALGALPDQAAFTARPDIADDTFLLLGRVLSYCPELMTAPLLQASVNAALMGIHVQHMETCSSIAGFLHTSTSPTAIAKASTRAPDMLSLARSVYGQPQTGPRAARLLVASVLGVAPWKLLEVVLEPLLALVRLLGLPAVEWIQAALQDVPEKAVPVTDKQRLLQGLQAVAQLDLGAEETRVSYVTEGVVRESLRMAEYCRRAPKISVAVVGAVMRPLMAA